MTTTTAHKLYQVTRDGSPVSPVLPTHNDAFGWVLRDTSVSFHHATTHEGYAVAEISPAPRDASEAEQLTRQARFMLANHGHRPSDRDRLTRENCGACVLAGYDELRVPRPEGRGVMYEPNYVGWPRVYVQAGVPVPERWRAAFIAELNDPENTSYAAAIARDIATYGIRFV